jgi:hypothetical protein
MYQNISAFVQIIRAELIPLRYKYIGARIA